MSMSKQSKKEAVVLKRWYLRRAPTTQLTRRFFPAKEWIVLEGQRETGETSLLWHSSHIHQRVTSGLVKTLSESEYILEGDMDEFECLRKGFSTELVSKFANGFPADWWDLVVTEMGGVVPNPRTTAAPTSTLKESLQNPSPRKIASVTVPIAVEKRRLRKEKAEDPEASTSATTLGRKSGKATQVSTTNPIKRTSRSKPANRKSETESEIGMEPMDGKTKLQMDIIYDSPIVSKTGEKLRHPDQYQEETGFAGQENEREEEGVHESEVEDVDEVEDIDDVEDAEESDRVEVKSRKAVKLIDKVTLEMPIAKNTKRVSKTRSESLLASAKEQQRKENPVSAIDTTSPLLPQTAIQGSSPRRPILIKAQAVSPELMAGPRTPQKSFNVSKRRARAGETDTENPFQPPVTVKAIQPKTNVTSKSDAKDRRGRLETLAASKKTSVRPSNTAHLSPVADDDCVRRSSRQSRAPGAWWAAEQAAHRELEGGALLKIVYGKGDIIVENIEVLGRVSRVSPVFKSEKRGSRKPQVSEEEGSAEESEQEEIEEEEDYEAANDSEAENEDRRPKTITTSSDIGVNAPLCTHYFSVPVPHECHLTH